MSLEIQVRKLQFVNLFYILIFCYFLTLSADVLYLEAALFKIKVNHFFAFLLFSALFITRRGIIVPKDLRLPAVLILSSLTLSSLGSVYWQRCFGYCGVYVFTCLVYFLVPYSLFFHFDKEKIIKCYFASFYTIGGYTCVQLGLSIGGIYTPFLRQWIEPGGWARAHGLSYEPSFYALYMCAFVMTYNALYFFDPKKKGIIKLLGVNILLLVSTATSGFFAYFFLIPFLFIYSSYAIDFKKKIIKFFLSLTSFLVAAALFAPKIIRFFIKFFVSNFSSHHSFAERWEGIVNSWHVFCDNPFLGVGIGGIGPYLYYQEKIGMQLGSFGMSLQEVELYDPKNVATEVLAGLGLFGVIAFITVFIWIAKRFNEIEKKSPLVLSLFIGLFVIILVLQFNPGLFRCYIWVHAAITLGYARSLLSKSQP